LHFAISIAIVGILRLRALSLRIAILAPAESARQNVAMPSIFQPTDSAEIVKRIQSLRPDAEAQWGKMQVAQMLAHLQQSVRVATGDLKLKRALIGILFGRMAKKGLTKPTPFKRGLPTAPEFRISDARDFASEQRKLVELVQRFSRGGPAALTKEQHPFFGSMTSEEWDLLQWKHLDHHLRQFGA